MCGLYGYHSMWKKELTEDQKQSRQNVIEALMLAMQDRGKDSTGVAIINGKEILVEKKDQRAFQFIRKNDTKTALRMEHNTLIGHTRFATTGKVEERNAHPFQYGDIVGAHNGVVTNWLDIDKEFDKLLKVDSEAIFALLNRTNNGFRETFSRLTGDFAITWVNANEPGVVYVVRNTGRPLYMAKVDEIGTIFWASNGMVLGCVLRAAFGDGKYKSIAIGENKVYRIDQNLDFKMRKVEFKTKHAAESSWSGKGYYGSDGYDYTAYDKKHYSRHAITCDCDICSGKDLKARGFQYATGKYHFNGEKYESYIAMEEAEAKWIRANKKELGEGVGSEPDVSLFRSQNYTDGEIEAKELEDYDESFGGFYILPTGELALSQDAHAELCSRANGFGEPMLGNGGCDLIGTPITENHFFYNPTDDMLISDMAYRQFIEPEADQKELYFKVFFTPSRFYPHNSVLDGDVLFSTELKPKMLTA